MDLAPPVTDRRWGWNAFGTKPPRRTEKGGNLGAAGTTLTAAAICYRLGGHGERCETRCRRGESVIDELDALLYEKAPYGALARELHGNFRLTCGRDSHRKHHRRPGQSPPSTSPTTCRGPTSSNVVDDDLRNAFPIDEGEGEVSLGGETSTGALGVEFVYPNPRSDRLVQVSTGSTLRGARLTRARNWLPTLTASADYHVFDDTMRYQKWNAAVAAGFFDTDWQLSAELGVLRNIEHEN